MTVEKIFEWLVAAQPIALMLLARVAVAIAIFFVGRAVA